MTFLLTDPQVVEWTQGPQTSAWLFSHLFLLVSFKKEAARAASKIFLWV